MKKLHCMTVLIFFSMMAFAQSGSAGKKIAYKGKMEDVQFSYPATWKLEDTEGLVRVSIDNGLSYFRIMRWPLTTSQEEELWGLEDDGYLLDETTFNGQPAYQEVADGVISTFLFQNDIEYGITALYSSERKTDLEEMMNSFKVK